MKSLYEVLGVGRDASREDITSAYRKKALLHHPDRNPGDKSAADLFMRATEAYSVLSDAGKKFAYDQTMTEQEAVFDPFEAFPGAFGHSWGPDVGRWPVGRTPRAGADVETQVGLTVEEAVLGTTKKITSATGEHKACDRCSGSRAEPGTRRVPCTACAGLGRAPHLNTRCAHCGGSGEIPLRRCAGCVGTGRTRGVREIDLKIPAGISDGQRLRMAGCGESGDGGPTGDMYVTVKVVPGGPFSRDGNDLSTSIRVPFQEAVGHHGRRPEFVVRGIDRREYRVLLPASFMPGETRLVIRGAGVGGIGGDRGDLHVVVHVDLPDARTARAAALLRELSDELAGDWHYPSPDGDS